MKEACLRALTHSFAIISSSFCICRNERSLLKGIDTICGSTKNTLARGRNERSLLKGIDTTSWISVSDSLSSRNERSLLKGIDTFEVFSPEKLF